MNNSIAITKRNIKIFLRNKISVIGMLLLALIPLLVTLVLKDIMSLWYVDSFDSKSDAVTALIVSTIGTTVSMVILVTTSTLVGQISSDYDNKIMRSFLTAPIKRTEIVVSYMISSLLMAYLFSFITMIIGCLLILLVGGQFIGIGTLIKLTLYLIPCSLAFSSFMFMLNARIKTISTSKVVNGLNSGLMPQIAGAYFPLTLFPVIVVKILAFLPILHVFTLLKKVIATPTIIALTNDKTLAEQEQVLEALGLRVVIDGFVLTETIMILALIGFTIIFTAISFLMMKNTKEK